MITVGVVSGKVAYVSSSAAGDGNVPAAARIGPVAAWRTAAASVDRATPATAIGDVSKERGWTTFTARGLDDQQRRGWWRCRRRGTAYARRSKRSSTAAAWPTCTSTPSSSTP